MKCFVQRVIVIAFMAWSASVNFGCSYAASLQCQDLPQVIGIYLRNHYTFHKITDPIKTHTIERFLKDMDPSKTLLLEEDFKTLKKKLPAVFSTMQLGNCSILGDIYTVLIQRAEEDRGFVEKYLGSEYKLDENIELLMNPDKRGYAKTSEQRQSLLKKMVHFQISNYLLAGLDIKEAKKNLLHRYELVVKRLKGRTQSDLYSSYLEAFATALDPHSSFLSQDNLEDFQIQMRLSLEGIGASLASVDGFTQIEELISGGGAERSKMLRPKDKIVAVAEEGGKPVSVIDMELREVVKLIRGAKGTKVTLSILRQGKETESFNVTIIRDKIDIKEQAASISYEQPTVAGKKLKVGIIDLPSFYGDEEKGGRSSSVDVRKLIEEAKAAKVDGLVLDLSRNGGGLLQEAVKIGGLFIKGGGIVATKESSGKTQVLSSDNDSMVYSGPLVVLTSHLSASASEILAGALKDYHRALVVGADRTFGKGSVQAVSPLQFKLGAVKMTIGMFFLPAGQSTQYIGVPSDIVIPSVFGDKEIGEKSMEYSLPPQSIEPFVTKVGDLTAPGQWEPIGEEKIKRLAKLSKERVEKDAGFAKIKKDLIENEKNKGIIRLSYMRKMKEKEKKTSGDEGKGEKKLKDLELPLIKESVNILADMVTQKF